MTIEYPEAGPAGHPDELRPGGWNGRLVGMMAIFILLAEVGVIVMIFPINALSQMAAEFKTDQLAWVQTAPLLISAMLSPIIGKLADQFGKKRVLLITFAISVVGMLISAFAPNFAMLLVGRFLQGLCLAFVYIVPSLIRDVFPTKTIPLAVSLSLSGSGLLTVGSALFIGPIIEHLGFRATFWIPALIGAVTLVLIMLVVPESEVRAERTPIDWVGAVLLGGGMFAVLAAVSFGGTWGWGSPGVLGAFAAGAILIIVWVLQALRARFPLIDLRSIVTLPIMLTMLYLWLNTTGWVAVLIPVLAGHVPTDGWGLGLTPTQQGILVALNSFAGTIAGWTVGIVLRRMSAAPVMIGLGLMATAGFVLAFLGLSSIVLFVIAIFLLGASSIAMLAASLNLIIRLVPVQRQAVTSAVVTLVSSMAAAVSPVILFAVMNGLGTPDPSTGVPAYTHASLSAVTLIPAVISASAVLCAVALQRTLRGRDFVVAAPHPSAAPRTADRPV